MISSHGTLRVLSVLLLGLRAGPRDWPLTDTEERPSRARRGLHPSKMEVRVAGAVWTRRQTTDPHNSSHNQPSLGSPPPPPWSPWVQKPQHSTAAGAPVAPSPGQRAPHPPSDMSLLHRKLLAGNSVRPQPREGKCGRCCRRQPGLWSPSRLQAST